MVINMWHDPEVPAGYQDADIEMAELREAALEAEKNATQDWPCSDWLDPKDNGYCNRCGFGGSVHP